jgi:hypothetical protein
MAEKFSTKMRGSRNESSGSHMQLAYSSSNQHRPIRRFIGKIITYGAPWIPYRKDFSIE